VKKYYILRRTLKSIIFFVMVDMAITSLENRFEELQVFKNIFGFLLSSRNLTYLDDVELTDCCIKF
jgi:hypothetical protein